MSISTPAVIEILDLAEIQIKRQRELKMTNGNII